MARGRGAPSAFAARTGGGGAALRSFGGGDDLDLLEPALPPPAAAAAAGYRAGESPARGALAAGCYVDDARARASPRLEAVGSRSKPLGAAAEPGTAYNRLYTTRDPTPPYRWAVMAAPDAGEILHNDSRITPTGAFIRLSALPFPPTAVGSSLLACLRALASPLPTPGAASCPDPP